jgi:hypothetical protein
MLAFHFHRHLLLMGHYVKFFPANFAISPAFQSLRDEISKASVSGL